MLGSSAAAAPAADMHSSVLVEGEQSGGELHLCGCERAARMGRLVAEEYAMTKQANRALEHLESLLRLASA